mmetsp:Transcript_33771/g.82836  ORF Transcript_33771/g.82836 Transcript_33771/m.82836 type:complete len:93 (-) Transcript_33771:147-425(-)
MRSHCLCARCRHRRRPRTLTHTSSERSLCHSSHVHNLHVRGARHALHAANGARRDFPPTSATIACVCTVPAAGALAMPARAYDVAFAAQNAV